MSAQRKIAQTSSILAAAVIIFVAGAVTAYAAPQASLTAGDKCTVTSGPNKGKTGTYGSDGWCEGDWGGTACGTTKCKIVASTSVVRGSHHAPGSFVQELKLRQMFKFSTAVAAIRN